MTNSLTRSPRAVGACLTVALAAGVLGCSDAAVESGGSAEPTTVSLPQPRLPPNVVSQAEIERQQTGSPERDLLMWWQAFQFRDDEAVLDLTATETLDKVGEANLRDLVEQLGPGFQGIKLVSSTQRSDTATVRALLLTFDVDKNGVAANTSTGTPITFDMVREDEEWKFRQTAFLQSLIEQANAD